jgi:hypothetical protein
MKKGLIKYFILGVFFAFFISSVSALVVDSVIMDSSGTSPGEEMHIEIGLRNNGDEDVEDVSVFLDLKDVPFAPFDSSSEFGIDKIKEDKLKFAEFDLIALNDANSQTYKIPVQISYNDEGEIKIKNSLISIDVHSEPVLGVSLEEGLLLKGNNNEVAIKIINKGLSDIKFLEVEIEDSNKFELISPNNIYVGDLDSDDFDSVNFKVFFDNDVSDKVKFIVNLNYKDSFNNEYEKEFEVKLKVYSRNNAIDVGLIEKSQVSQIITIIIILIVIWFIYRWWRRRRKLKEIESEKENQF